MNASAINRSINERALTKLLKICEFVDLKGKPFLNYYLSKNKQSDINATAFKELFPEGFGNFLCDRKYLEIYQKNREIKDSESFQLGSNNCPSSR